MGVYEPLKQFLRKQAADRVPLTFSEIEQVLGRKLPARSKHHRAWWSNNPDNNVMTKEWLEAGFESEAVDIAGEKLVFRRVREGSKDMKFEGFAETPQAGLDGDLVKPNHPGFGFMKGLIQFDDDFDPTEPTFPDWEQYEEEKYGSGKLHE